ncbi:hypothetical protein EJB05_22312, partial [Eragrostis curvula]
MCLSPPFGKAVTLTPIKQQGKTDFSKESQRPTFGQLRNSIRVEVQHVYGHEVSWKYISLSLIISEHSISWFPNFRGQRQVGDVSRLSSLPSPGSSIILEHRTPSAIHSILPRKCFFVDPAGAMASKQPTV